MRVQPGEVIVNLNAALVEAARKKALDEWETFRDYEKAHYKDTKMGHFVGKLGEYAVDRWAAAHGHSPHRWFLTDNYKADIYLPLKDLAVEVKSWREDHWDSFGATVNEGQLDKIRKKARICVWCAVECPKYITTFDGLVDHYQHNLGGVASVYLKGWNWVSDLARIPAVERKGLLSRKVPHELIRRLEDL